MLRLNWMLTHRGFVKQKKTFGGTDSWYRGIDETKVVRHKSSARVMVSIMQKGKGTTYYADDPALKQRILDLTVPECTYTFGKAVETNLLK